MNTAHDKVFDHTREQLSALFDGELAPDEGRFLQRRLQHDADLAGCVSRWQSIGDVLRGQAAAAAPAGFSARVATAVAAEPALVEAPAARAAARRRWVPGAALAASVAMVAWFAMRQAPEISRSTTTPPAQVAQARVAGADPSSPTAPPATIPAQPAAPAPDSAGQLATAAVAAVEVPRRIASRRNPSRSQVQRAATTRVARQAAQDEARPQFAVASAAPAIDAVTGSALSVSAPGNPFAPAVRQVVARPWPRALLPSAGGVFNVGYGSLQRSGEPFHPFQPQPVQSQPQQPAQPPQTVEDPQAQKDAPAP